MNKSILLCSLFFVLFSAKAQQIQWASKLIKFSTDLGGKQNGIKRILGKPDAFPQGGSSANAWMPKKALDGSEIIEVGFEKPQTVKQVAVCENLNSGCVVKISVDNGSGNYETVWTRKRDWKTPTFKSTASADHAYYFGRKRRKVQEVPDVFNPGIEYAVLENAVANVVAVKVEFNFALLSGQKQIDAIGISDSEAPIEIKVNSNPAFENLPNPESLEFENSEVSNVMVSQDGQKIFYSAFEANKDVVFSSLKQTDGKWAKPLAEPSLSLNDNYNYLEFYSDIFILKGGVEYTKNSTETGFEFFENKNGSYQSLKPLKIAAYNNYEKTADVTITNDGKTLIMAIETDFTQGGTDLYFANQKEDGTYGLLQNMGKIINSADDEGMPQLLSDTRTLLFSSLGFSSYGNYDIYVSYRLDDTWKKWSEPINLGNKINSDSFEGSPFYDETTEMLYFTRVVEGKSSISRVKIFKNALMKN
jgi:Tol biopolymer transport system component